jgi:hypothetical protein
VLVGTEYVGWAFVVEPDGDEVAVRASLRGDDEDWGRSPSGLHITIASSDNLG